MEDEPHEEELPPEEELPAEEELPPEEELPAEEEEIEEAAPEEPEPQVDLTARGEVPLTLTVEVGRVQMTAEKLMSLEPGNMLEMGGAQTVNLTLGGKAIGRGELMRVGDALGVRILELG